MNWYHIKEAGSDEAFVDLDKIATISRIELTNGKHRLLINGANVLEANDWQILKHFNAISSALKLK